MEDQAKNRRFVSQSVCGGRGRGGGEGGKGPMKMCGKVPCSLQSTRPAILQLWPQSHFIFLKLLRTPKSLFCMWIVSIVICYIRN